MVDRDYSSGWILTVSELEASLNPCLSMLHLNKWNFWAIRKTNIKRNHNGIERYSEEITSSTLRRENPMKCQSDYDNKDEAMLRQADECMDPWWEPDGHAAEEAPTEQQNTEEQLGAAETEAIRRGLLKQDESGDLCVSCPEGDD
jgi:hypothetical protein